MKMKLRNVEIGSGMGLVLVLSGSTRRWLLGDALVVEKSAKATRSMYALRMGIIACGGGDIVCIFRMYYST